MLFPKKIGISANKQKSHAAHPEKLKNPLAHRGMIWQWWFAP
jgi:hypothetical protein